MRSSSKLSVLDLFSGIGGFSLGLERTGGFSTSAFCEIDDYARRVLARHWPGTPVYEDIRILTAARLLADGIGLPDVICGGFPCQDLSKAGEGRGLAGARSGLWFEYARLIEEIRPRWVVAENVAALRGRGLDQVLRSLDEIGFDAEWRCIPASSVGAPHHRDRIWIVAYPSGSRVEGLVLGDDARPAGPWGWRGEEDLRAIANCPFAAGDRWPPPLLRGVDARIPARVDRLRCVGNSVVPAIATLIGRAILAAENEDQMEAAS